ncbi:recombinase family protein [Microcoleus sp. FACHB-1515]|uniref:recombinase family protein n=1 Tax=Cyanophyceae TaxID=3028117 RepID=UPI00168A0BAE|nr:recombinase family protein [Microcoleus sp. FACHB-1515]MBD2088807.1 recombinase family protein [Microcoleus sp. FACHB-1515]
MTTIAYLYLEPLLDTQPNAAWGQAVDRVYSDWGDRSQWDQLLQDCQTASVETVLVRRLADLGETVAAVSDRLTALEALGITLISLEEPIAEGLKRSDLLRLLATLPADQRQQKLRLGHARNRLKALPPPGKAPYGYRRGKDRYAIDRATAPVVKDFFDHFLLYGSLRGSVRHLEKKYGKKISASTGKRWLTSPIYRGDLVYQTGEVMPNTHPAILPRAEAAQIDRLLRRNRRLPPRTASAPRSLAGLVTCAQCQSGMTIARVKTRRQEYLYLRPTSCPQKPKCRALAYEEVLRRSIEQICAQLPAAVAATPQPDVSRIQQAIAAEIAAKESTLAKIPTLEAEGILDAETAELRIYKLKTELATLQAKLAQLPPANLQAIAQTVSIPQFWLDLSEAERRFYFREFLRTIEIDRSAETWQIRLVLIF